MADLVEASRHRWRYMMVGLVCAGLHNVVMIVLNYAGLHYQLSLVLSVAVTGMVGYTLHSLYTFRRNITGARLSRFISGIAIGFVLNFVLMYLMCDLIGISVPIATPIATALLFFFNFAAARWAIYLHRDRDRDRYRA